MDFLGEKFVAVLAVEILKNLIDGFVILGDGARLFVEVKSNCDRSATRNVGLDLFARLVRIFLDEFVADFCGGLTETIGEFDKTPVSGAIKDLFKVIEDA